MRKLIQGGTVVNAGQSSVTDVLVDGEEIAAVGSLGDVDAEVIDASGCYVLPGLIDNHTHMAMPFGGTVSIDDYDTGTRAAAAGGTTCIVDFVIQQHPDGLRSSLEEWQGRADGAAHVPPTSSVPVVPGMTSSTSTVPVPLARIFKPRYSLRSTGWRGMLEAFRSTASPTPQVEKPLPLTCAAPATGTTGVSTAGVTIPVPSE